MDNRMRELVDELNRHAYRYYVLMTPLYRTNSTTSSLMS